MMPHILRLRKRRTTFWKRKSYIVIVYSYKSSRFSIGIVVLRPTTIVSSIFKLFRQLELIAYLWQYSCRFVRCNSRLQFNRAIGVDGEHLVSNEAEIIVIKRFISKFLNAMIGSTGFTYELRSIRRLWLYGESKAITAIGVFGYFVR